MSLHSETTWVDAHNKSHRLEEMSASYRQNVLNFVRRNALVYYAADRIEDELFDPYEPAFIGAKEMAFYVGIDLALGMYDQAEAEAWVEETPLVSRLKSLGAT